MCVHTDLLYFEEDTFPILGERGSMGVPLAPFLCIRLLLHKKEQSVPKDDDPTSSELGCFVFWNQVPKGLIKYR